MVVLRGDGSGQTDIASEEMWRRFAFRCVFPPHPS